MEIDQYVIYEVNGSRINSDLLIEEIVILSYALPLIKMYNLIFNCGDNN